MNSGDVDKYTVDQRVSKCPRIDSDQQPIRNSNGEYESNISPNSECSAVKPGSDLPKDLGLKVDSKKGDETKSLDILPTNVRPSHYDIFLTPGLENFKFKGQVTITLIVKEVTNVIEMNANDITIESINIVSDSGRKMECVDFRIADERERLIIKLDGVLQKDEKWVLNIKYVGNHSESMVGFYRVAVNYKGNKEYMYATQFESNFCRMALPCWDEPNIKCTFDVKMKVPTYMTALSNMDVCSEQVDLDTNMKIVKYNTTPLMSTYLLAFIVGRYTYVEKYTTPRQIDENVTTSAVRCRVYAHEDSIECAKFALECGCEILEFFEEYFKIPYPLPKMDQVPICNFRSGAMENWGLVTYREAALLLDLDKSGVRAKHLVYIYIGHEFAHQWFGNLATMKWWNDLWLNEGFATFAGTLVLDKLYPEWAPFQDFISDELYPALSLDSMNSTHPIDVPVYSSTDVPQIFDAISYSKGASVIRMIFSYLGEEKFRNGLSLYLKSNAYSNAETRDMWLALREASDVDVDVLMENWVSKPGYPLVRVLEEKYDEKDNKMTILLEQQRYYASGKKSYEHINDETIWWIPLTVVTHENTVDNPVKFIFNSRKSSFTFSYKKSDASFWKLNAGFTGLYHVRMKEDSTRNLTKLISDGKCDISIEDKMHLLSGAFSLAKSGDSSFPLVFDTLIAFRKERNYYLLKNMADMITTLSTAFYQNKNITTALENFAVYIFKDTLDDLGYEKLPDESELDSLKRKIVISVLAFAKYEPVLKYLRVNFDKIASGKHGTPDPDLREVAYVSVLKHSTHPKADFDLIVDMYKSERAPDQKIHILCAFGAVNDTEIVKKLLDELIFDEEFVKQQDVAYIIKSIVSENPYPAIVRPMVREFLRREWDRLIKWFNSSPSILGRIVSLAFCMDSGSDAVETLKAWINGDDIKDSDNFESLYESRKKGLKLIHMQVEQASELLEVKSQWVEKRGCQIEKWLKDSCYMH